MTKQLVKNTLSRQSSLLFLLCLLAFSAGAGAQTYRPLKMHIYGGYGSPSSSSQSNGFVGGIEPRYGFTDRFEVGLRLEVAYLTRTFSTFEGLPGIEKRGTTSYIATANYFLGKVSPETSKYRFRPYLGVGVGNYRVYSSSVTASQTGYNGTIQPVSRLGGMARLGVKINHVNLSMEYNQVGTSTAATTTGKSSLKNSYLSVKAGFDIGGGRK